MALFWCSIELPQIEHYDFMRQYSWVLRLPHLAFGFLAPLGIVGLIVTLRNNRKVALLLLFLLAYFLSVAVFFVAGRYRLPIHPVLMVLAAAAFFWGRDRVKERHYQAVLIAVAGWMVLCSLSHWPSWAANLPDHLAEKHFQVGSVAELQGRTTEMLDHYQRAVAHEPCHVKALLNLGLVKARQGDVSGAERLLREAIRCEPTYARAYFNLAIMYSQHGHTAEAEDLLLEATRMDHNYGEAWRALGIIYAASGRIAAARQVFGGILEIPVSKLSPRGANKLRQEAQSFLEQLRGVPEGQAVTDLRSP
jgi:tetratricopeptide (TPR) repeat protein